MTTHHSLYLTKTSIANITLIILFLIGIGIPIMCTPRLLDDYSFIWVFRPWFESQNITDLELGGDIIKTPGFFEHYKNELLYRFNNDNIRLGNIIAPLLLIIPLWIGRLICLFSFYSLCWYAMKISNIRVLSSPLISIAILGFTFFLPWHDFMFTLDFMLNYIISSALAILIIDMLFISKKIEDCKVTKIMLLGLLALITGAWHEGISCPVLGALVILSALYKSCRTKAFILVEIGLTIGIIYLALCPGMQRRTSLISSDAGIICSLILCAKQAILFIFTLILMVIGGIKNSKLNLRNDKLTLFLLLNCFLAYGIVFIVRMDGRTGWWGILSSIILLLRYLSLYGPNYFSSWSLFTKSVVGLCSLPFLLLGFIRLGYGDFYTLRFREIMHDAIESYYRNPQKTVFTKVFETKHLSPLNFYFPYQRFPNNCFTFLDIYTRKREKGMDGLMYVVPEELKFITPDSGVPIEGDLGIRIKDGFMFMPCEETTPISVQVIADFGNGPKTRNASFYQFISEKDGKRYAYVEVYSNWIDTYLKHIKSLSGPVNILREYPLYYDWEIGVSDRKLFSCQ